ncbi:bicaudal-D-related protein 2-like [Solea solea]|uniref:bicaudal-D-related protein 2-like n=1 Tax=Solea solea TaxID=90069 RepID=UPI00272CD517|nr:bicaudal-D-related protein 2-like [Solea solea]
MDFSQPFSVLNERLKPRGSASEQLHSSLSRLEDRQMSATRTKSTYRPTVLPAEPDPKPPVALTQPEDPQAPGDNSTQEDAVSTGSEGADLQPGNNFCLSPEIFFQDDGEEEARDEDSSSTNSEEKDNPGELAPTRMMSLSGSVPAAGEGGSPAQLNYIDATLPDLLHSGRPLSRRRTLGHVSATLNEVRREVELSRRRSIKLKAQVDKLQESRSGQGWSQHRERVTEEVLSVLRLLHPLTDNELSTPEPPRGDKCLDIALGQLQNVARHLAISHTKQECKSGNGKGEEDSAILQQALWDRDEAIEKKKAMEAELLRSKTEMMLLNNQLLEAVQKRLELSLELEAWKEDVQLILQQNLQNQQQAQQQQQPQKKTFRSLGILRRTQRPPIQRPAAFPVPTSPTNTPITNPNQIFIPRAAVSAPSAPTAPASPNTPPSTPRNWRERLRRGGKTSRQAEEAQCAERDMDGFQVVSLD